MPLPIPLGPFNNVSMDFMTCLLEWEGTDAIFVVVDKFSKLVKFAPTQTNAMVVGMAKLFFDMWVWHNGMTKVIVNDWDVKSMLEFWTLFMKKVGSKLKFSTVFHPQTNGQIEIMNMILNQYFHNYIADNHKDWGRVLLKLHKTFPVKWIPLNWSWELKQNNPWI